MTIQEFAAAKKVKVKTVESWIEKGLIPLADLSENYVPNSARAPYTGARAKKSDAIYTSIVRASKELKHVLPSLYGICDEEFEGYIDRLVEAGFIERRTTDGVTYYDATLMASNTTDKAILHTLEMLVGAAAYGIAKAHLEVAYS